MTHKIEELDRQIIIQRRLTTASDRDVLGGIPYEYEDYITGDGNGIPAGIFDSSSDDILTAAQHQQKTNATIIVRYDSRIKPTMRVKYRRSDTEVEYYDINTTINEKFENRFMRLLVSADVDETVELPGS